MTHLTPRGDTRSAESSSKVDYARSRSDRSLTWRSIGRSRHFVEELHGRGSIELRSRRDRAVIGERTWWNHLYDERTAIDERPGPWSWPDRDPIAARSWPDHGWNACYSEAKLTLIHGGIEATTSPQGTAPTKPWINLHDHFNWPRSSGQFHSLKPMYLSLWNSTFDRFMKELSEFQGRSLVHRDPPAFRLDCDAIGAGLIANFSLISSNFPLEFRTSARKNPSRFTSIHENWSPILAAIGLVVWFNRLSGGNLSFY